MKQARRNFSTLVLMAALLAPVSLLAQKDDKDKEKEKKSAEQIIITRKNDNTGKVVVEVDGDKVTVNGKPIDELQKDGDITVRRVKIRDMYALADGMKSWGNGMNGFSWNGSEPFKMLSVDSNRALLGVTTEKNDDGAVEIQSVTDESAAAKAGLKKGDIIRKVDDSKIESPDDLSEVIKNHKPGDKVSVAITRDKKDQTITAELGKWKGTTVFAQNYKFDWNDLDMGNLLKELPRMSAPNSRSFNGQAWSRGSNGPKLGISVQDNDEGAGVKVLDVDDDGTAAKAGLKEDDVITEVDGKQINGTDDITKIIRDSRDKNSVMMKIKRGNKTQNVEVRIPRKLKTADL